VGLSDEGMGPAQVAHNCKGCSAAVRAALAEFNRTQDLGALASLSCACQQEWKEELSAG
jgi:uncharacterized Fe-S cluster-containing MiaB family protein